MSENVPIEWLSAAIDEIYFLRAVLADEASIAEAHLGYKTFPKTRRPYVEEQAERMSRFARGETWSATREKFDQTRALRLIGADECLTNSQWLTSRGLHVCTTDAALITQHETEEGA